MSDNILARYGMGATVPGNMLSRDTLKPGPAPTGYDRIRDSIYNMLGGRPENAWAADKLATAADWGTLGMLTGAYDGGQALAKGDGPSQLAMALMPGAKSVNAAAKVATTAAGKVATEVAPELAALMRGQVVSSTPRPMPSYAELEALLPKTRRIGTPEEEAAKKAELDEQLRLLREQMKPKSSP
jgi:hypothetical protein